MVISRTPFRISFFGGGTDFASWYREYGGAVLAASIDKYCYLSCRFLPPFFEHRYHVVWSRNELCSRIADIQHPSVRCVLEHLRIDRGLSIHHDGDLPARSGMGSSSAFTVGLLHALHALHGRIPNTADLAKEAIHVEQTLLRETVGCQDQVLCAHGGVRHLTFAQGGEILARPLTLSRARLTALCGHMMLFYTGLVRNSSDVAQSYATDIHARSRQLHRLQEMVELALEILKSGADLAAFGELLHESWLLKRSLSPQVSNPAIDDMYAQARSAGALGGKLTGAGGGGFLLLFVPPERRGEVQRRLAPWLHVPFEFEYNGSQIIFYDPEADYSAIDVRPLKAADAETPG